MDLQLFELGGQLALGASQRNRRHLLVEPTAVREEEVLRTVANPQINRDVSQSIFVATVVITVGQKAAYGLTPSILIMQADARVVDTDELDIAALFNVEQPSSLPN